MNAQTVSFDSGYWERLGSNRAFWNFGLELDGLVNRGLDKFSMDSGVGKNPLVRALVAGGAYWFYRYPQYSYFVANHEFGHGTRFISIGVNPVFAWDDGSPELDTVFQFYVKGWSRYGQGAYTAGAYSPAQAPDNWDAALSAGGVNNSAAFAEAVEDAVTRGRAGIASYTSYVWGKSDAAAYVDITKALQAAGQATGSGDMEFIVDYYEGEGFDIDFDAIREGSLVSRWASSTYWLILWSALRFPFVGDTKVVRPFLGPLRLPDLSHYLNLPGLSYKLRSGIGASKFFFPLEVEHVYRGRSVTEIAFGVETTESSYKAIGWGLKLLANTSGGYGVHSFFEWPLGQSAVVTTGASVLSMDLLEAGRNSVKINDSLSLSQEYWARLGYVF
jgi:hypothetical protein